jgi:dipeptidyl aminopeptidase/acylaminoacyl peptidase
MDTLPLIPYGLWPSPVSPEMLGGQVRLEDVQFDSDGQKVVWLEGRSGRGVLVCQGGSDAMRDLTAVLSVRAGVGYGGGDFTVSHGRVFFVSEGRLQRQPLDYGQPEKLSPAFGGWASPSVSPDGRWAACVHSYERADSLALVPLQSVDWPLRVAQGADFYMQPAWHPNSRHLAWIEWDHPNMPWDGTRLVLAHLDDDGRVLEQQVLAGDADTPVFQPAFSPDGRSLAFVIQDGDWDSLCLYDLDSGERRVLASGGVFTEPAWVQGLRTVSWAASGSRLYAIRNDGGFSTLWSVDAKDGAMQPMDTHPYTSISQLSASPAEENTVAFIASAAGIPPRVVLWQDGQMRILCHSQAETIAPDDLPVPQSVTWKSPDGTTVYGLYYPPTSRLVRADGLPPALVHIHGGPTAQATSRYNRDAAYFATRGYGYLEVNYRGSTGYGRTYMLALRQKWGLADVEDAFGGAQALIDQGLADPGKLVIIGGSAGGYTVLNALVRRPGFFKAGVNLYGVADLFNAETHKFEERYNDLLVGVLPKDAERFRAWSPVYHADQIHDPIAVFQGADDPVVPPAHSDGIVAALRANKVPHIYKVYEGEGHGWRKTETIVDYYHAVEKFLQQYVLFA